MSNGNESIPKSKRNGSASLVDRLYSISHSNGAKTQPGTTAQPKKNDLTLFQRMGVEPIDQAQEATSGAKAKPNEDYGTTSFDEGMEAGWKGLASGAAYAGGEVARGLGFQDTGEGWQQFARDYQASAPQNDDSWGFFLGSLVPSSAPTALAVAAAPFTGGGSLAGAASIGALSFSSAGSGMMEYEQYKRDKGQEVEPMAKLAVGAAYGAAEGVMERFQLGKLMPKGFTSKFLKGNVEAAEQAGMDLLDKYAKKYPGRSKELFRRVRSGMGTEGLEEVATEIAQAGTELVYQEDEDRKETIRNLPSQMFNAFLGGSIMGGALGPLSYAAQNKVHRDRRRKQGSVVLAEAKDGQAYELIGRTEIDGQDLFQAMGPNGEMLTLPSDQIVQSVNLTPTQFDKLLQDKLDRQQFELSQREPVTVATYQGQDVRVKGEDGEGGYYITDENGQDKNVSAEELSDIQEIPPQEQMAAEGNPPVDQPIGPVESLAPDEQDSPGPLQNAEGDFIYPGEEGYEELLTQQQGQPQAAQPEQTQQPPREFTVGKGKNRQQVQASPQPDGSFVVTGSATVRGGEVVPQSVEDMTAQEADELADTLFKDFKSRFKNSEGGFEVETAPSDPNDPFSPMQIRIAPVDPEAREQQERQNRLDENYEIQADGNRVSVVNLENDQEVGPQSQYYLPKVRQYFEQNAAAMSELPRATDDNPDVTQENFLQEVASYSENPVELSEAYLDAVEQSDNNNQTDHVQMTIAHSLAASRIHPDDVTRWGDRNQFQGSGGGIIRANYTSSNAVADLDVRAEILSDQTGQKITPEDIIDFMVEYPNGPGQYLNKEDEVVGDIRKRFQEVTGVSLSKGLAESITSSAIEGGETSDQQAPGAPQEGPELPAEPVETAPTGTVSLSEEEIARSQAESDQVQQLFEQSRQQLQEEGLTDEEITEIEALADESTPEEVEALERQVETLEAEEEDLSPEQVEQRLEELESFFEQQGAERREQETSEVSPTENERQQKRESFPWLSKAEDRINEINQQIGSKRRLYKDEPLQVEFINPRNKTTDDLLIEIAALTGQDFRSLQQKYEDLYRYEYSETLDPAEGKRFTLRRRGTEETGPVGLERVTEMQTALGNELRAAIDEFRNNNPEANETKSPWQMTREEWNQAREEVRPNTAQSNLTRASASEAANRGQTLDTLLHGVRDEARQRLMAAQRGELSLSQEEVDALQEQIDMPVRHRDVVEKAMAEGKPVPESVLDEYPDLQSQPTQQTDEETNETVEGETTGVSEEAEAAEGGTEVEGDEDVRFSRRESSQSEVSEPRRRQAADLLDPTTSAHARRLANGLKKKTENWAGRNQIFIAEHPDQLPGDVRREMEAQPGRIGGLYFGDTAYVFTWNLNDGKEADMVLAHEAIGHGGIRGLLTHMSRNREDFENRLKALSNEVYESFKDTEAFQDIVDSYGLDMRRNDHRQEAAEEYIAWLAEHKPNSSIVDKFVKFINDLLRELGLSGRITNGDIKTLLADARQFMESGTPSALDVDGQLMRPAFKRSALADTFYGKLNTVIASDLNNKGTPEQFEQTLQSWNKKGKFKTEELEWSGLIDWLGDIEEGPVFKQDVLDFLAGNQIEIKEVVKNQEEDSALEGRLSDINMRLDEIWGMPAEEVGEEEQRLYAEQERIRSQLRNTGTKYEQFTLPGGQSYRELLLTLPEIRRGNEDLPQGWEVVEPRNNPRERRFLVVDGIHVISAGSTREEAIVRATTGDFNTWFEETYNRSSIEASEALLERAREEYQHNVVDANTRSVFKSSHYDEPNILAHVRFNERTDTDGNRVLFLEEIQSDWHQKGREVGYRAPNEDELQRRIRELSEEAEQLRQESSGQHAERLQEIRDETLELTEQGGGRFAVPDTPFKTTWHELLMKRMLRYGAEHNFDKVGWTTGEQQADRYDLSKQVERIEYYPQDQKLLMIDKAGKEIPVPGRTSQEALPDVVGKELAERIVSRVSDRSLLVTIRGDDIKVGGEGMKGFYNKMIPRFVSKYTKKWDAKVAPVDIALNDRSVSYVGPEATPEQIQQVRQDPTLTREERNDLAWVVNEMNVRDRSFSDAMGRINRDTGLAEKFGGRFEQDATAKVLAVDITPEMRRDILTVGQPLFNRLGSEFISFEEGIEQFSEGKLKAGTILDVGNPGQNLRRAGMPDVSIGIPASLLTRGKQQEELPDTYIKNIPKALNNPVLVFAADSGSRAIIVTEAMIDEESVPAALQVKINERGATVSDIRRIEDFGQIGRWAEAGQLRYADQRKALEWIEVARGSNSLRDFNPQGLIRKINETAERSNIQTDTDTFRQWFGDSHVVGSSGAPLVVYHGTPDSRGLREGFQSNTERLLGASDPERAFFFTNSKRMAGSYADDRRAFDYQNAIPETLPVYLSISNPLIINAKGESWNKFEYTEGDKTAIGTRGIVQFAKEEGYDGVIVNNVRDHYDGNKNKRPASLYIAFEPTQIKSATENRGTFDSGNPDIRFKRMDPVEERPGQWKRRGDNFLRKFQDKMLDIKRVQQHVVESGGTLTDETNTYRDENQSYGRIEDQIDDYEDNYETPLVELVNGKYRKKDITYDDVRMYLWARHAPERNADLQAKYPDKEHSDMLSGMPETTREVDGEAKIGYREVMQGFQERDISRDLEEIGERVDEITSLILDKQLESGLISQQEYNSMREQYDHYVPLRGFAEYISEDPTVMSGNVRAEGRISEPGDILGYLSVMAKTAVMAGEKNKVKQTLLEFVRQNWQRSDLFRIRNVYFRANGETDENGVAEYEVTFERPSTDDLLSGKVKRHLDYDKEKALWDSQASPFDRITSVSVLVDGRPVVIEFTSEHIARAIRGIDVDHMPKWLSGVNRYMGYLRNMITQYSPEFALRNLFRDSGEGFVNLSIDFDAKTAAAIVNPVKIAQGFGALRRAIRKGNFDGDWGQAAEKFMKLGGMSGWWQLNEVSKRTRNLKEAIENGGFSENPWVNTKEQGRKLLDVLDDYNRVVENIIRVSTFKYLTENNVVNPDTGKPFTEKQAAAYGKDLTVNFNRKGLYGGSIGGFFLFFNAAVQGIARQAQPFFSEHTRTRWRAAAAPVIIGTTAYLMIDLARILMGRDEDEEYYYDKINEWTRTHNIILPNILSEDPEDFLKIPLPYGYNTYYAAGDALNRLVTGATSLEDAALQLSAAAIDSYNPIGTASGETAGHTAFKTLLPTVLKPGHELVMNLDFAGRPIKPEPFPFAIEEPQSQQYYPWVGSWAKETSKYLNELTGGDEVTSGLVDISPEHLEYVVQYFGGGSGRFLTGLVNTSENIVEHLSGEEDMELYDIYEVPFARSTYGKVSSGVRSRRFREHEDEIKKLIHRHEHYHQTGQLDKADRLYRGNQSLMRLEPEMKAVRKQIKSLYDWRRVLEAQKTTDESKERIKQIEQSIEELYDGFNRRYNELEGLPGEPVSQPLVELIFGEQERQLVENE